MGVRLFVASFFLFVLVVSQGLQPRQAEAWCCGCSCMYYCTCSGYWDGDQQMYCWWCGSTKPVPQQKGSINASIEQPQPVDESLLSSNLQADMIQQVTELRVLRPCLRNKIALSLLGDYGEAMKFELMRFDEKNAQGQTVAFQVDRQ